MIKYFYNFSKKLRTINTFSTIGNKINININNMILTATDS